MILKAGLAVLAALAVFVVVFVLVARKTSSPVRVEHVFNSPPEAVWKHWVDPESMKRWWGPKDFTAPVIQNDPRAGGRFLLSMRKGDGEAIYNTGRYTEVVPMQRMVSSMSFSDAQGNPIPGSQVKVLGDWPDEVMVSVEFSALEGGKTRVSITETGIPLIMKLFAKMGWEQQFDKFEKLL